MHSDPERGETREGDSEKRVVAERLRQAAQKAAGGRRSVDHEDIFPVGVDAFRSGKLLAASLDAHPARAEVERNSSTLLSIREAVAVGVALAGICAIDGPRVVRHRRRADHNG